MPDKKKLTQILGRVGKDPIIKETPKGELVEFSVAVSNSYDAGDTTWYQIAVFNDALRGPVKESVFKGATVAIEGNLSTREVQGKVYYNVTAFKVGIVDYIKRDGSGTASNDVPF